MADNHDLSVRTGGCLCGAVRYEIRGPLSKVVACHCEQCRRTSGHHVASTDARRGDLRLLRDDGLAWYRSSDTARRGFCRQCGGNLFWDGDGAASISIMAGTLDKPTGLTLSRHIFVDFAGDYYTINDGLPRQTGEDWIRRRIQEAPPTQS